ncbi:cytochrome c biogenesis protein CcsA [Flammeovirgaceae bacterium SG7u.111]|nr:cytochrome c biogenesis protein CcsA [Flammeovirgaceae bacterium SG7u.132]WPO33562.1 cytochrome c biogenesis protein CcsA [Flammeovirgaceae bacterium SG7u.111]
MGWVNFPLFAAVSSLLWISSSFGLSKGNMKKPLMELVYLVGVGVFIAFIAMLWQELDRPPMRTLGETRLWYSIFLPIIGYLIYKRWNYVWILWYSVGLAILFLVINYLNPETHDKALMPALQSPWFVPHVIVYIFSYALLAASCLVAVKGLYHIYFGKIEKDFLKLADNLVYIGFSFLTFGLLFGALWAKEAWGHYWTWDPKETWAFLTWISYLIYMHLRHHHPAKRKEALWALSISFLVLLVCWFGINYLPSAQSSVHTYSS